MKKNILYIFFFLGFSLKSFAFSFHHKNNVPITTKNDIETAVVTNGEEQLKKVGGKDTLPNNFTGGFMFSYSGRTWAGGDFDQHPDAPEGSRLHSLDEQGRNIWRLVEQMHLAMNEGNPGELIAQFLSRVSLSDTSLRIINLALADYMIDLLTQTAWVSNQLLGYLVGYMIEHPTLFGGESQVNTFLDVIKHMARDRGYTIQEYGPQGVLFYLQELVMTHMRVDEGWNFDALRQPMYDLFSATGVFRFTEPGGGGREVPMNPAQLLLFLMSTGSPTASLFNAVPYDPSSGPRRYYHDWSSAHPEGPTENWQRLLREIFNQPWQLRQHWNPTSPIDQSSAFQTLFRTMDGYWNQNNEGNGYGAFMDRESQLRRGGWMALLGNIEHAFAHVVRDIISLDEAQANRAIHQMFNELGHDVIFNDVRDQSPTGEQITPWGRNNQHDVLHLIFQTEYPVRAINHWDDVCKTRSALPLLDILIGEGLPSTHKIFYDRYGMEPPSDYETGQILNQFKGANNEALANLLKSHKELNFWFGSPWGANVTGEMEAYPGVSLLERILLLRTLAVIPHLLNYGLEYTTVFLGRFMAQYQMQQRGTDAFTAMTFWWAHILNMDRAELISMTDEQLYKLLTRLYTTIYGTAVLNVYNQRTPLLSPNAMAQQFIAQGRAVNMLAARALEQDLATGEITQEEYQRITRDWERMLAKGSDIQRFRYDHNNDRATPEEISILSSDDPAIVAKYVDKVLWVHFPDGSPGQAWMYHVSSFERIPNSWARAPNLDNQQNLSTNTPANNVTEAGGATLRENQQGGRWLDQRMLMELEQSGKDIRMNPKFRSMMAELPESTQRELAEYYRFKLNLGDGRCNPNRAGGTMGNRGLDRNNLFPEMPGQGAQENMMNTNLLDEDGEDPGTTPNVPSEGGAGAGGSGAGGAGPGGAGGAAAEADVDVVMEQEELVDDATLGFELARQFIKGAMIELVIGIILIIAVYIFILIYDEYQTAPYSVSNNVENMLLWLCVYNAMFGQVKAGNIHTKSYQLTGFEGINSESRKPGFVIYKMKPDSAGNNDPYTADSMVWGRTNVEKPPYQTGMIGVGDYQGTGFVYDFCDTGDNWVHNDSIWDARSSAWAEVISKYANKKPGNAIRGKRILQQGEGIKIEVGDYPTIVREMNDRMNFGDGYFWMDDDSWDANFAQTQVNNYRYWWEDICKKAAGGDSSSKIDEKETYDRLRSKSYIFMAAVQNMFVGMYGEVVNPYACYPGNITSASFDDSDLPYEVNYYEDAFDHWYNEATNFNYPPEHSKYLSWCSVSNITMCGMLGTLTKGIELPKSDHGADPKITAVFGVASPFSNVAGDKSSVSRKSLDAALENVPLTAGDAPGTEKHMNFTKNMGASSWSVDHEVIECVSTPIIYISEKGMTCKDHDAQIFKNTEQSDIRHLEDGYGGVTVYHPFQAINMIQGDRGSEQIHFFVFYGKKFSDHSQIDNGKGPWDAIDTITAHYSKPDSAWHDITAEQMRHQRDFRDGLYSSLRKYFDNTEDHHGPYQWTGITGNQSESWDGWDLNQHYEADNISFCPKRCIMMGGTEKYISQVFLRAFGEMNPLITASEPQTGRVKLWFAQDTLTINLVRDSVIPYPYPPPYYDSTSVIIPIDSNRYVRDTIALGYKNCLDLRMMNSVRPTMEDSIQFHVCPLTMYLNEEGTDSIVIPDTTIWIKMIDSISVAKLSFGDTIWYRSDLHPNGPLPGDSLIDNLWKADIKINSQAFTGLDSGDDSGDAWGSITIPDNPNGKQILVQPKFHNASMRDVGTLYFYKDKKNNIISNNSYLVWAPGLSMYELTMTAYVEWMDKNGLMQKSSTSLNLEDILRDDKYTGANTAWTPPPDDYVEHLFWIPSDEETKKNKR